MRTHSLTLLISLATLSACAVGPAFERPDAAPPAEWNKAAIAGAAQSPSRFVDDAIDERWWAQFNDPVLTELVERARAANLDVRIAALRVAQSRVQREATRAGLAPQVNASASYERQRQSEFGTGTRLVDVIGAGSNREAVIEALSEPFEVYQAGFDASWELDLWGRVRHATEAAYASFGASVEDLHAVQLVVAAETARTYLELRGNQDQLRIAREDIAASDALLTLTESRAAGGLTTQLDVARQRARLAEARARIPQLAQTSTQLDNTLALLLGEQPGVLALPTGDVRPIPSPPAEVALGLPSQLAQRRPDIRGAEARLRAASAEVGVATADLYPRLMLTGGLLSQALNAADIADFGARQWVVGPSLSLPLFDGGRRRAVVELRDLQQQEAAVNYQRTVLRAWREIDDALSAHVAEQRRHAQLIEAANASKDAFAIARLRYEHGLTNFLVVLDAQRSLLEVERARSDSDARSATQLVALYKALGGGWGTP